MRKTRSVNGTIEGQRVSIAGLVVINSTPRDGRMPFSVELSVTVLATNATYPVGGADIAPDGRIDPYKGFEAGEPADVSAFVEALGFDGDHDPTCEDVVSDLNALAAPLYRDAISLCRPRRRRRRRGQQRRKAA